VAPGIPATHAVDPGITLGAAPEVIAGAEKVLTTGSNDPTIFWFGPTPLDDTESGMHPVVVEIDPSSTGVKQCENFPDGTDWTATRDTEGVVAEHGAETCAGHVDGGGDDCRVKGDVACLIGADAKAGCGGFVGEGETIRGGVGGATTLAAWICGTGTTGDNCCDATILVGESEVAVALGIDTDADPAAKGDEENAGVAALGGTTLGSDFDLMDVGGCVEGGAG